MTLRRSSPSSTASAERSVARTPKLWGLGGVALGVVLSTSFRVSLDYPGLLGSVTSAYTRTKSDIGQCELTDGAQGTSVQ